MRIRMKDTGNNANSKVVVTAVMIVLIIMAAVYFVSAQFRPDGSDTEDTYKYETFANETDTMFVTDDVEDDADVESGADLQGSDASDSSEGGEETVDMEICEHCWDDPHCDSPMTCSLCGKTEGEPLGHIWREATCISPRYCSACGTVDGGELGHEWTEATCTEAETCSRCGEIQGKPLGHDLSAATCTEASRCNRCGKIEGDAAGHKWKDATCTKPKRCSRCGEEKGDPLGHNWREATCTKAETCSRCSETKGDALGHDWKDATCTKAKRCSRCDKTSGSPLGHKYSSGSCTVCKATDPDYDSSGSGSVADGSKPIYVNNKKSGVTAIAVDGQYYVSVGDFAKAVDPDTSFKISDNGSTCTVSAKGIDVKAIKGKIYVEANGRALPSSKLSADNGKVTAPLDIMAKIFSTSVTYSDDRVVVTESDGYITSGDDIYDADALDLLSRVINSEAGEESFNGMLAVGAVIMNRVGSSEFPSTVYAVVYQKNQFSVVDTDAFLEDPNELSVIAAKMCLEGYRYDKRVLFFDSTGNAWASKNRNFLYKIGNHYFYD